MIILFFKGESTQSSRIVRQTECGIPSPVTNLKFTAIRTNLVFHWNSPLTYNGNTTHEEYEVRNFLSFY